MHSSSAVVSVGIAAAAGADVARAVAAAAEREGLHALWVNDTPAADALAVLAAAAEVTSSLVLATGVLPLDRRSAAQIVARVRELDLPADRLVLGVGSGARREGALALVREGAQALRAELGVRVMVGALGPRMRGLGAADADGVLLSWLTADAAAEQAHEAHAVSADAHAALYVRTAVEHEAVDRMDAEAQRYASFPAYEANLSRLGLDVRDTVIRPDSLAADLGRYRGAVDEVVLRAITPADEPAEFERFVVAVAAATR